MDDIKEEVQDPFVEVNLGTKEDSRITFVSGHLGPEEFNKMMMILKEYKDCFAWDYPELPGLSRKLVEHRLPIKEGFQPFQQSPRRMAPDITLKIKEEIERLVRAGFIRLARYVEWLSNIVPVLKKNGKLRICIDFKNINMATSKDEYPMPVADLLVDGASGYKVLSFMDGYSGYNQIFIAENDVHKTAFRCPGSIGTFEWVVMPFGLKNTGATYQRAMNSIFHDMIGKYMEVYIDDIVVKSQDFDKHLENLEKAFIRIRKHQLKMNPLKCAFGVTAGNFLGFLVHNRGIEVDKNKAKAILQAKPPSNKKELQRLLGQINFLRRFIANVAGKTKVFSPLLRLKDHEAFIWHEEHQKAFNAIKHYLTTPPVLIPPKEGKPLKLYIFATQESIGSLLAQDNEDGHEQAVFYLSRILNPTECKYSIVEKPCLALYFSALKLRHYMLAYIVFVIAQTNVIKYMLSKSILSGRMCKWSLVLVEFHLLYVP
jgi:hypothetical protein